MVKAWADAKSVGASVANRLHSEVDSRKGTAAAQVNALSSALEQTAGGLDDTAPAWLKSALDQGVTKIQSLATTLEQKDSRELVNEISNFARQSPGTFLLACGAAGFAAARLFKAGTPSSTQQSASSTEQSADTTPQPMVDATNWQDSTVATNQFEGEPI